MSANTSVFEKTYANYIKQIASIDLATVAVGLGAQFVKGALAISSFHEHYTVSENGILSPSGRRAALDTSVILCQYILRCPSSPPPQNGWVAFRDFKDSGPLTVYFANDVEKQIARSFSGNRNLLERAGRAINGYEPEETFPYDLAMQFDALPKIALLLLFNDVDEEFPAQCSVLFQQPAEIYLDAESLAMLGRGLATRLIQYQPAISS